MTAVTVMSFGRRRCTAPRDGSLYQVGLGQRLTLFYPFIERFVQIDDHYHARFDGDAEERNVAHPYRNAEVVAERTIATAGRPMIA